MAAAARRPGAALLLLLVFSALLLDLSDAKKKSPAKKVGFLKTKEKRSKYATWVFDQYDENNDSKLSEDEIDTANSDEPLIHVLSLFTRFFSHFFAHFLLALLSIFAHILRHILLALRSRRTSRTRSSSSTWTCWTRTPWTRRSRGRSC
jgi:hypothetical protein